MKLRSTTRPTFSPNKPLIFQITDWYSYDADGEEDDDDKSEESKSDNDGDGDGDGDDDNANTYKKRDTKKYFIRIFGVDSLHQSVSVLIHDFPPYFFIKVPDTWGATQVKRFSDAIREKIPKSSRHNIVSFKLLKKHDFIGFSNNKLFNFIRIVVKNKILFYSINKLFQKPLTVPGVCRYEKFKIYESNIDPMLRFMHTKDLFPSGWVKINAGMYTIQSPKTTSTQIDVSTVWSNCERYDRDSLAKIIIASYDIEADSSHGDFPLAKKDYRKLASDIYYEYNKLYKRAEELRNVKEFNSESSDLLTCFIYSAFGDTKEKVALRNKYNINKIFTKDKKFVAKTEYIHTFIHLITDLFDTKTINNLQNISFDVEHNKVKRIKGGNDGGDSSEDDDESSGKTEKKMKLVIQKINKILNNYLPPVQGDKCIQIGTTVHYCGESECFLKHIITLDGCEPIEGAIVESYKTEREVLLAWTAFIQKLDPDIIVGYNIFGFDFKFLYGRSEELDIKSKFCNLGRIKNVESPFVEKTLASSALGDNELSYIEMHGRVLIDLLKVIQRDHKLDSYKLDAVANHFMGLNKCDISPADIFRLQKGNDADRREIAVYCIQDCVLLNKLVMKLEIMANNVGMANVCSVPLSYIFLRGQGIKIFSLVAKECRLENYLIPVINNRNDDGGDDKYEGAIVLNPMKGIYLSDPITVVDYGSLYPSSMISENLSHDSIISYTEYDLEGKMTREKVYYDRPLDDGWGLVEIEFDLYGLDNNDKKYKSGKKICRFAQPPNGGKSILPKILQKVLKARKDTRKKCEYITFITKTGEKYTGLMKEKGDEYIINENNSGKMTTLRKNDVKEMADTYNDFEKVVLDGLQLAFKVTANSIYGQVGSKVSQISFIEIAASTTAVGRNMIMLAKNFSEKNYSCEVIYGDSVANYTPVYVKVAGKIDICTIEDLAKKYGNDMWVCMRDKEFCELADVETWTERGWTRLYRVIRHKLVAHKKMCRILTHTGLVDVTDDHSLLKKNGEEISPRDVTIGTELLHHKMTVDTDTDTSTESINKLEQAKVMGFFYGNRNYKITKMYEKRLWILNNVRPIIVEKYVKLCKIAYPELEWVMNSTFNTIYPSQFEEDPDNDENKHDDGGGHNISTNYIKFRDNFNVHMYNSNTSCTKIVPNGIINGTIEIRQAFWEGVCDSYNIKDIDRNFHIDQKNQMSASHIAWVASSLGYNTSINTININRSYDKYRVNMTKSAHLKNPHAIKKKYEIPYDGYVYDLTTENHHFAAGIGNMIVHNTDSVFIKPKLDPHLSDREKLKAAIEFGMNIEESIKPLLKYPHVLEYEKTFFPFIIMSKKRYIGNLYEKDPDKYKQKSMGIVLKRRDNAQIVKHIYGGVIDIIMNKRSIDNSITFLNNSIKDLVQGKFPLDMLIVTKSLRSDYKNPESIAHKVLADRMGERDPGNKPGPSDRIPYVYINLPPPKKGEKILQGNRIEHPEYIKTHNLKPDYEFYLTNQIMKPVCQIYGLIVEKMKGYKHPKEYFKEQYKIFHKKYNGDETKTETKIDDLKNKEAENLLFGEILREIKNRKTGNREITNFFKGVGTSSLT